MQIVVANAAQRHCELITDLAAKRTRLGNPQVMRLRRRAPADEARLTHDKPQMLAASAFLAR